MQLLLVVGLAAALGIAAWLLFPRREDLEEQPATWVLTKEGPVRFHGAHVLLVPWEAVARIEPQVHVATLLLHPGRKPVRHHVGPVDQEALLASYTIRDAEVAGTLSAFVQQATMVVHDPTRRASLPTFTQPEGPPAAVLAGLAPLPQGADMFRHDLKTLCAGLDPSAFPEEHKLLSSCGKVADLEWLANNDGGWLSPQRRNPKIKLVRHGTGTFLVVKYDDGWSSTLSKAPFRS